MTMRLRSTLVVIAVLASGAGLYGIGASAQQAAPSPPAAAPAPGPRGPGPMGRMSDQDRSAFLDARIAALHAGLQLSADQERRWAPVEAALRDMATTMRQERQTRMAARGDDGLMGRLHRAADTSTARGQVLTRLAAAADPLYTVLSDEQRRRVPLLVREMQPRPGLMMRMMRRWRGQDGMEGGPGGRRRGPMEPAPQ